MEKKRDVTAMTIEFVDPDCWIIAGHSLSELKKNSFYFDIKITDETNTKDEKARYIRETFAGFEKILGDIHEESYVYVQDIKAAAYGYGGKLKSFVINTPVNAAQSLSFPYDLYITCRSA